MFLCTWLPKRACCNVMCNARSFLDFLIAISVSFHPPLHNKVFLSSVKPIFPYASAPPMHVDKTRRLICCELGLTFRVHFCSLPALQNWAACALVGSVRETRLPGKALFLLRKREAFLEVVLMKEFPHRGLRWAGPARRSSRCWLSFWFSLSKAPPWKQTATRRGTRCSPQHGTLAKTMRKHCHELCFTGTIIHEDIKNVTCVAVQSSNCRAGLLRAPRGESQILHPAAAGLRAALGEERAWGWAGARVPDGN